MSTVTAPPREGVVHEVPVATHDDMVGGWARIIAPLCTCFELGICPTHAPVDPAELIDTDCCQ